MEDESSSKTEISLKGSVDIVSEFFFTAINSILYQRGIYLPETFTRELKYGLTCLTTTDEGLLKYLANVQQQVFTWLETGNIQRLVVVVKGVETKQTLERWQFNVAIDQPQSDHPPDIENKVHRDTNIILLSEKNTATSLKKPIQEIHKEIQAIIRQITASVTFLPLLQESCTFDLLVYTDRDIAVPAKWADSDPCYVTNSSEVKLRTFTTSLHKIDSMVAYKKVEDWEL